MNNYRIVIDPGHGGNDITEKNMTLAISNYMYDRFMELGIPVKMIRTTDETLEPNERIRSI